MLGCEDLSQNQCLQSMDKLRYKKIKSMHRQCKLHQMQIGDIEQFSVDKLTLQAPIYKFRESKI